ncbi:myosin-7-like [Perca flavescens]|uniref:myosin-7-like n=1 Tax=Perca flavescens TaxID=8167 RepID=UPI00106ED58F|nr:myosin-7-like [Perca flavescens]
MENSKGPLVFYRLATKLEECELEKKALAKQVEELKAQLQSEEKVKQPATKLEGRMIPREQEMENLGKPLLHETSTRLQEKLRTLQDEVRQLNDLLGQERAINFQEHNMGLHLSRVLQKTAEQLARQKSLKEIFIKKEKEARRDLERLKRLCDTETMDGMRIATDLHNDIKKKKKKELQKDYEVLKVNFSKSQEKFSAELGVEKDRNEALQQELERLKVSHHRSETELEAEREKSGSLQKRFEKEIQSQAERVPEKLEVIKQLRAERDALLRQTDEEIQTLNKQNKTNQELVTKLRAEAEVSQGLWTLLAKLKDTQKDEEKEAPSTIH